MGRVGRKVVGQWLGWQWTEGAQHLELFLQLGLQVFHAWRQQQPGWEAPGAPQKHGVCTIEELVPKEGIILPAITDSH